MKIAIGADHAGYELKEKVKTTLEKMGIEVKDFGPFSEDSVDYPDYAHPVANAVETSTHDLGILMCGSGNGINMAANKHAGIRSALCWTEEIASMARLHNNANVLAMPARYISEQIGLDIVKTFVTTEFEGGRHQKRIDKISC
ncbi:MAG: ribose 5-phosphate isomerase B [Flavobacteriales bacterium]|jgi:ribose 5-phosphate isomerase B